MRKLLVYIKDYKKETILAPLFKMLEATFELFVPLVMAAVIDQGIGSGDISYVLRMGGVLVLLVFVSPGGNIMVGDEEMQIQGVKDKTKEFILNPMEAENLPEKKETELELPDGSKWVYPVSEGVVSLQTTRDTNYDVYIMVQNELTRAFNEVRDEVAMSKFGAKFSELPEEQRNVITKAVPLKVSEAEPRKANKK